MTRVIEVDLYGEVIIRSCMMESSDGTSLFEGVEITLSNEEIIEVPEYYDIEDLSEERVLGLIEEWI